MHSNHGRRYAVAVLTAVALGPVLGSLVAATSASAAEATITTDAGLYGLGEVITASGSCGATAETAVVRVRQAGVTLAERATDVVAGRFDTAISSSGGGLGPAVVAVDCLVYGASGPVGTAQVQVHLLPDGGEDHVAIDVAITPSQVAVGDEVSIGASCPAGTTNAIVQVGNATADDAFVTRSVTPTASGRVSLTVRLDETDGVAPEAGAAVAVVECGDPAPAGARKTARPGAVPFGVGIAGVDLLTDETSGVTGSDEASGVRPDGDGAVGGRSDGPLSLTGAELPEMVLTALALLVAGMAVVYISRRNRRA